MNLIRKILLVSAFFVFTNTAHAQDASTVTKDYKADAASQVKEYEKFVNDVKDFEKSPKFNPKILDEDLENDITLGDPKAPVKVVEYASLTCIHCKAFHTEVFFDLKKNYIDTGKVYFKFRHYPLNASAVKAALMVDCADAKDKLAFISALFDAQSQWGYANSEADLMGKLQTITKIAGFSNEKFQQCWSDDKASKTILELQKRAYEELNVTSTPGIFVNGHRYLEGHDYPAMSKAIDAILAKPADKKTSANPPFLQLAENNAKPVVNPEEIPVKNNAEESEEYEYDAAPEVIDTDTKDNKDQKDTD